MRVAAVVLNYRTPEDTVRAVEALQASNRRLGQVIVVDNHSNDGSEEWIRKQLSGVTVLQSGANLGFSGGCNVGIRHALACGAGAVLLVNSDAVVGPECVDLLRQALANPQTGIAGPAVVSAGGAWRIESAGLRYSPSTGRMTLRDHGRDLLPGGGAAGAPVDAVSGTVMLVKRAVFERVGLFAEEFFYSFEDLDLCLRARAHGFDSVVVTGARAMHLGGRSIGAASPRRLYFAARNHLLLASRTGPHSAPRYAMLLASIVLLNLAHALRSRTPVPAAVGAVLRGTRDHFHRRYGNDG